MAVTIPAAHVWRGLVFASLVGALLAGLPAIPASANEARSLPLSTPIIEDPEAREILTRPTFRQQISKIRFPGDQRTYEFLVGHPPLATQLARRLDPALERYTVTEVGQGVFTVEDRGTLRGEARLIKAIHGQRVYRFEGEFRSLANLLRFTGRMVLILDYRELREGDRIYTESESDFYLRIDHVFFGFMAKLLTPLIRFLIDRRVHMIVEATDRLFERLVTDPEGLYREMATWKEVRPEDLEAYRQAFTSKGASERR